MASELKGNAIVSGYIDFYCLVCECHLRGGQDARIHIDTPLHRENLPLYPYLEQYQQDRIRKIKKLYFCELCDLIFTTMTKVILHSKDGDHIYKRGEQHIKRIKNYVVVSDGILITELVWNGILADSTCTVCNTEVDDVAVHLVEQKHLLNLIGTKIHFCEEVVYRKIDETTFHCFVCNMLVALNTISTHSVNKTHKQHILSCQADFEFHVLQKDLSRKSKNIKDETIPEGTSSEIFKVDWKWEPLTDTRDNSASCDEDSAKPTKKTSVKDKDAILKESSTFQKSGIKDNIPSAIFSCNECSETMKFDDEIIKQHILSHENNATKKKANKHVIQPTHSKTDVRKKCETSKDTTTEIEGDDATIKTDVRKRSDTESNESWLKVDDDLQRSGAGPSKLQDQSSAEATVLNSDENLEEASFAKQNDITYNDGRSEANCCICRVRLPSSLKSMKEHVNSGSHKTKSERQTRKDKTTSFGNPIKIPFNQFVDEIFQDNHSGDEDFDVIIKDELCVSHRSFHSITGIKYLRCQVCEKKLSGSEVDYHVKTSEHKYLVWTKPVITNWKNEFIREVQSGIFHCGFCNSVAGSWNDLNKHLQGQDHINNRKASERRLAEHLPKLRAWRNFNEKQKFLEMMMQRMLFN